MVAPGQEEVLRVLDLVGERPLRRQGRGVRGEPEVKNRQIVFLLFLSKVLVTEPPNFLQGIMSLGSKFVIL